MICFLCTWYFGSLVSKTVSWNKLKQLLINGSKWNICTYDSQFQWIDGQPAQIEYTCILTRHFSPTIPRTPSYSWSLLKCPSVFHWRHNGRCSVSHHQPYDCLLNCLFRRTSKKTSKLRVTGLCVGNSPHKWPITRKMFPFDDVIMYWTKS